MQYCDGTNWYAMKDANQGSCSGTTAGTVRYSSNLMEFCDGSNWWDMECPHMTDVTASTRSTYNGCAWNRGTGLWSCTVTLTNTSGSTISGPVDWVVTNQSTMCSSGPCAFTSNTGTTSCTDPNGDPYYLATASSIGAGSNVQFQINYSNPNNVSLNPTVVVYSGSGTP